jgi:DNA-binding response OmpR family regulator
VLREGQDFTILIVEDQALIALSIEDVARAIGSCAVGIAARVADALTLIETAPWDAALLDLRLEDEMVYPAAERLRAKGVPFAFVTAWDGEIDAPFADVPVLQKPFGEAELASCLRALIESRVRPAGTRQAA